MKNKTEWYFIIHGIIIILIALVLVGLIILAHNLATLAFPIIT
jgi:hypothetical protein